MTEHKATKIVGLINQLIGLRIALIDQDRNGEVFRSLHRQIEQLSRDLEDLLMEES